MVRPSEDKIHQMLRLLGRATGAAIVYVNTRKATREIAGILRRHNLSADYYHAGLDPEERHRKQEDWMLGKTRIIVSTNAFGMGIDKGDVRLVLHLHLPESLEAYFQEAGRAGRDGQKAWAILLYHPVDSRTLEDQYLHSFPELEEVRRVYRALGSYLQLPVGSGKGESYDFDLGEFCQRFDLPTLRTYHALQLLRQEGVLDLTDSIRTQSALHFKVNSEQLYDYQLRNPTFDPLIKTILRQYHGALTQPVYLKEQKLARFLKISQARLQQLLQQLHKENIATYIPHKDKPQLTFLTERLQTDNLSFDLARYKFRKERFRYRIDRSMEYATAERCRSQLLLEYFGEKTAPRCGVCDVCLAESPTAPRSLLREQLKDLIQRTRPQLQELLDTCAPEERTKYRAVLDDFMQERLVVLEGTQLIWKK
jgi:ATP-dependent DNA helicase RecQ